MTISEEIHCVCVTARLAGHVSEEDTGMTFAYTGVLTESTIVPDTGAAA